MKASFCTRAYLGIRVKTGNRDIWDSIMINWPVQGNKLAKYLAIAGIRGRWVSGHKKFRSEHARHIWTPTDTLLAGGN